MQITNRAAWGAAPPKKNPTYVHPSRRRYFIVHHSGAPSSQKVKDIQHWCMEGRGFNDIDYNFLVGPDGTIYEGRGWDVIGAHTTNYNTLGVGVCVIGDNELSPRAARSVKALYDAYVQRCGHDLMVRGHRQLATTGTTCPGDIISHWLAAGMPISDGSEDVGDKDMAVSDDDLKRISNAVWGHTFGSDSTAKRWPDAPEKRMDSWTVLAAMNARDSALGNLTSAQLAEAVVGALSGPDLADVLRRGLSDDERAALVAELSR